MLPDFESQLRKFAEVIVRVGLNLQRGQRLLIAEPYELQGVARSAEVIVNSIKAVANCPTEVIWGDGPRLRELVAKRDWHALADLAESNAVKMHAAIRNGDALLFLIGSQPALMHGLPADDVAEARRIGMQQFGPVSELLNQAATNWTAAPAPNPAWAHAAYADLPSEQQLSSLWRDMFSALRVDESNPQAAWRTHLESLQALRDASNAARHTSLRYLGEGTDLTVKLPRDHHWCTAQLRTRFGVSFVANLPTEEIFTAPEKNSARGHVRVSRPVPYASSVIEGLELEFAEGRVIAARARKGAALVERLLSTDEGAGRIGEVAIVSKVNAWPKTPRAFYHTLLDENISSHIALGEGYDFCLLSPNKDALNRSLIHLDLPLDARVSLEPL
jgi:aminopeptidase